MAWSIEGEYMENCNCEVLCPCITSSMAGPADNERCYGPLAMHIEKGEKDGVSLDGLNAVANTIQPRGSNLPIAKSVKGTFDDFGLSFDNTGKNGHYREFAWSG